MRKISTVSLDNRPRTRKVRVTVFFVLTFLLILSPVIYESVLVCAGRWQAMFGVYPNVRTPVLDFLSDNWEMATFDLKHWSRGIFTRTPWKSSYVIPFAIFWTGVLALLLRK